MRDILTILAAGALMAGSAVIVPTMVGAVQPPVPVSHKRFVERLAQAGGAAAIGAATGGTAVAPDRALPFFARR